MTYHPNGAIAGFRYGNEIWHTLDQNQRGLPERSIDTGVLNDLYAYDQNSNVTSILDWHEGVSNRAMEYDQLDRLKRTFAPAVWGDARYDYDALDNLTGAVIERGAKARKTVHTFDPITNRLKGITGPAGYNFAYDYDDQGNVKQRGAQRYVFDQGNRMKEATGKATYVYDGWGRRSSVVGTDGLNRMYVYTQDGKLMYSGPTSGARN